MQQTKFFPEFEDDFKNLLSRTRGLKVAIAGHMRPDGDCVSSQFALAEILKNSGVKEVVCVNQNTLPELYKNFAYGMEFLSAETFEKTDFKLITVDCADVARTNEKLTQRFPNTFACIDHHVTNNPKAEINILDPKAGATAEIIAGLAMDANCPISKENANRLFMGIAMDTRQFTTSSTRPKTFAIAAALAERGADTAWVATQLYQRESFAKLKLLTAYLKSLTRHANGRICMGLLPENIYNETGANKADSDGLVDFARSVEGVDIAVLLEQLPDAVKGSLRGKTAAFKVNEVASLFGGGGHLAAAGFTAKGERLETFCPKLISILEERLAAADAETSK